MSTRPADLFESDIQTARLNWQDDIWDVSRGVICPVCDRMGKVYARRFGVPMAKSLIWLYCASQTDWIHVPTHGTRYVLRVNQWGHMQKFGVVDAREPDPDSKTKHSGLYRITELGKALVNRTIKIPQYIFTYNDEKIAARGEIENITIRQALKSGGFDFDEIMEAAIKATVSLEDAK